MQMTGFPGYEKTAASKMPMPGDQCEYTYFLQCTERFGNDYPLFAHKGMDHSRAQFIRDIEALAAFYKNEIGLEPQDCVSILNLTCIEGIITYMALNKIGVIVNFIHPLYTNEQIVETVKACKSKFLCVHDLLVPSKSELIKEIGLPVMVFSTPAYAAPDAAETTVEDKYCDILKELDIDCYGYPETLKRYIGKPQVPTVPDNMDYICLYLNGGGTTGRSRTIMLSNVNINQQNYANCCVTYLTDEPGTRTQIGCQPFFHAYGLCAGGLDAVFSGRKIVYLARFDPKAFVDVMQHNYVDKFNGVPNMFRKLVDCPEFDCPELGRIEVMFAGGDNVTKDLHDRMQALLAKYGSNAEFHAGYGLTEGVASCTYNPLFKNREDSIGEAVAGMTAEIWDDDGNRVENGVIGEIVFSGPQIMEGYLNEQGTRGEGLYFDDQGRKWLRTGDLGRMDDDGYIIFSGRKKRVIIISGYNVFPGDIEHIVNDLPFVYQSCAVQGYKDGKKIVRLYIVPEKGFGKEEDREAELQQIRDVIGEKLSKFNMPRDIRYIEAMPLTKLEKIDFMSLTEQQAE